MDPIKLHAIYMNCINSIMHNVYKNSLYLIVPGKVLSDKDRKTVKKGAKETLDKLKAEKLKVDRWREKRDISAQVRNLIHDTLLYLPQDVFTDEDVEVKTVNVYQHVYANYYGGGRSVYQKTA